MTRWIDHPVWGDETGDRLFTALVRAMREPVDMEQVWEETGLAPGLVNVHGAPRLAWIEMAKTAAERQGMLEALLAGVVRRVPGAAAEINAVLAVQLKGLTWYVSPDRYSARLVGPGARMAMLDRAGLRLALSDIVQQGFPMVAITGCLGSGKSHSKYLIQHVATDPSVGCKVVVLDVDSEWAERRTGKIEAPEFANRLMRKLGGPPLTADLHTDHVEAARGLAAVFVGEYEHLPRTSRWIFIDGLDRDDVDTSVHEFVGFLAGQVVDYQLEETRLIVTGHPGDFPPKVLDVVLEERLDPLDDSHLELFFAGIAADVQVLLSPEETAELVRRVRAEADFTDLRQLGKVASTVAHAHFPPLVP